MATSIVTALTREIHDLKQQIDSVEDRVTTVESSISTVDTRLEAVEAKQSTYCHCFIYLQLKVDGGEKR